MCLTSSTGLLRERGAAAHQVRFRPDGSMCGNPMRPRKLLSFLAPAALVAVANRLLGAEWLGVLLVFATSWAALLVARRVATPPGKSAEAVAVALPVYAGLTAAGTVIAGTVLLVGSLLTMQCLRLVYAEGLDMIQLGVGLVLHAPILGILSYLTVLGSSSNSQD